MKREPEGRRKREEGSGKRVLFFVFFFLLLSSFFSLVSASPLASAEPFFVTIEKVELKNEAGQWVTIIEPDKKVNLAQEEPSVSFFNNGRVPPGQYRNVRVQLDQADLTRSEDYADPLKIKKGSFVNVAFAFSFESSTKNLSRDNFKQIHVTVDEDERIDDGKTINIGGR